MPETLLRNILCLSFVSIAKSIIINEHCHGTGVGKEWPSICYIYYLQCNHYNSKVVLKYQLLSQFASDMGNYLCPSGPQSSHMRRKTIMITVTSGFNIWK